jgi:type II secretory ATPase GspE/PulE/Tfp pilus assembly ATPase PilB-like protein
MLNEIDREHRNVVSLEDPIEYNVASMNQSQVFPEIGYTFASGLRSILRQDPDVIMVGEIRDAETAQLAIQAALTGHLVFSTIHTNTAIGVVTRLLDMGVEPYLIAPTLIATIGQRLSRQIAEGCASPMEMDVGMTEMVQKQFADLPDEFKSKLALDKPLHEAKPNANSATGLKGRVPVFEVLTFTPEIQEAVLHSKGEEEIWKLARATGMVTMKEDAILKSIAGLIPFTEINEL